jgi:hypothetical protein
MNVQKIRFYFSIVGDCLDFIIVIVEKIQKYKGGAKDIQQFTPIDATKSDISTGKDNGQTNVQG